MPGRRVALHRYPSQDARLATSSEERIVAFTLSRKVMQLCSPELVAHERFGHHSKG